MQRIRNYIDRFLKSNKINYRYCIYFGEVCSCIKAFAEKPVDTICTVFEYGYVKGYRAAMAEMKKGGVVNG